MAGRAGRGRVSAVCLPVGDGSAVEFRSFKARTPLLSLTSSVAGGAGRVLVTLTLPERLRAADVEFARQLAERAAAYAVEVERLYRAGPRRASGSVGRGAA